MMFILQDVFLILVLFLFKPVLKKICQEIRRLVCAIRKIKKNNCDKYKMTKTLIFLKSEVFLADWDQYYPVNVVKITNIIPLGIIPLMEKNNKSQSTFRTAIHKSMYFFILLFIYTQYNYYFAASYSSSFSFLALSFHPRSAFPIMRLHLLLF